MNFISVFEQSETWKYVLIGSDIHHPEKSKILTFLESYSDILTDTLGRTTAVQHVITLADSKPAVTPRYHIPLYYEKAVIMELKELLDMKIVEYSDYRYSSPLLPVLEKEGCLRLCVDYRKLLCDFNTSRTDAKSWVHVHETV